ncbi:5-3 exoribonuclease 1 [Pyrenophora tritici-repentis]|nr:5-3 exoribonuclease 1 [Pyrenophora tritici-repentis]KAI1539638.1 XRN1 5'-3' exonuclease [Pyrenophora tritici-repentis]KAI1586458.1 XRN1 5'-3' exonuclease [Pyrenophora tritici-repentis]KAI1602490.1 XRN1 5'-3' exonuclease [Pyrenophora tritici-repentis]
MQMRKVWKEIVTNKESHENEIVNDTLHIKWKAKSARLFQFLELEFQIFSNNAEMHEIEVLMLQLFGLGLALAAKCHLFSQQTEVGVMAEQTQHDQVGIKAVQAVATVRVVPRLRLRLTDVLHYLVLALSGDLVS